MRQSVVSAGLARSEINCNSRYDSWFSNKCANKCVLWTHLQSLDQDTASPRNVRNAYSVARSPPPPRPDINLACYTARRATLANFMMWEMTCEDLR